MSCAYSEIFFSPQGEGKYTGVPTAWFRFFQCNLQCDGFGQKDPTDPTTYILPYKDIDVSQFSKLEDLPVFSYGCDSSYSWSKKFKHLNHEGTVAEIAQRITDAMKTLSNPEGKFKHPNGLEQHMCFTGGEPMMKNSQIRSVEILQEFKDRGNLPRFVTYETNGTQPLLPEFINWWKENSDVELFFSVSPKLFTVSGETAKKAIKPDVVCSYNNLSQEGQLKFVVSGTPQSWEELDSVVDQFRRADVTFPIWIMPVGATVEGQELTAGDVAREAFMRGHNVAARMHVHLWGNLIGV
jgi:7-carboxy-7-deazaguanine synthase